MPIMQEKMGRNQRVKANRAAPTRAAPETARRLAPLLEDDLGAAEVVELAALLEPVEETPELAAFEEAEVREAGVVGAERGGTVEATPPALVIPAI